MKDVLTSLRKGLSSSMSRMSGMKPPASSDTVPTRERLSRKPKRKVPFL